MAPLLKYLTLKALRYGSHSVTCGCVCGFVIMITRNCMHRSSPNWVCR